MVHTLHSRVEGAISSRPIPTNSTYVEWGNMREVGAPSVGRTRFLGGATKLLLVVGTAMLLTTVALLIIAAVRHLSDPTGPVLPTSLCRSGSELPPTPLSGSRWITAWQIDWIAVAVVAGLGLGYAAGLAGCGRLGRRWSRRRTAYFFAGLAVLIVATCGPIAVYDMALFSAHMLGHLALVMVAPPLLILGRPLTLALHATRNPWHARIRRMSRSRPVGLFTSPPVVLASYAAVIVGTHLTGLMDVIMTRAWAGQVEHAAYVVAGCQFFVLAVGDEPLRWRLSVPARELLLAVAMAVDTFTGLVLLQSGTAIRMMGLSPRHVDPLAQTHLGGAIMWVGGDGLMIVMMIGLALRWITLPDHRRGARNSWIERARRRNLLDRTSIVTVTAPDVSPDNPLRDIDIDDRALIAYNAWLRTLAHDSNAASNEDTP